jgi:hypothetical protein
LVLPHHFGCDTGQTELTDIGHYDEGAHEDTLVSCFGFLNNFGTQDNVEGPGHGSSWDFVGILLDADFLPVGKLGLLNEKLP